MSFKRSSKNGHRQQLTHQGTRKSFTVGYVGEILLMEVKNALPRKVAQGRSVLQEATGRIRKGVQITGRGNN